MTDPDQPTSRMRGREAEGDGVLTRSEEELRIATHRREIGRARLTRYIETETETISVPVRREQVRIEYASSFDGDASRARPASEPTADGERWLVLYDEEVVVQTRWVARERVRLATHSFVEEREVSESLRKEQIAFEDGDRAR